MTTETDPVRQHADPVSTQRLDRQREERVADVAHRGPADVTPHLERLDREWDMERVLEANASALSLGLLAFAAARPTRRRLALAAVVPAFLLQHAVQGWCPPVALFRRLGVRTRGEIDAERTAVKALRGDFAHLGPREAGHPDAASTALDAAGRR